MGILDTPGVTRTQANATSLGAKLNRAASRAAQSNPLVAPPWIAPPAYADATSYAVGNVVSNAGGWYMCGAIIGGATSPTGGAPTGIANGQYIQYGGSGPHWTYLGGATTTASDAGAPTVSVVTTNPGGYAQNFVVRDYPDRYKVFGATPQAYRTTFWELKAFANASGSTMCNGAAIGFVSDTAKMILLLPSNGVQYRVVVDGRYVHIGSTVIGGNDSWMVIDWSAVGGKRNRTYRVETNKSVSYFGAALIGASDSLSAEPDPSGIRAAWISDSYNAGSNYGPWLAGGGIAMQTAKLLGINDMWSMAMGGTGDINTAGGTGYTFGQRVSANIDLLATMDVIHMMGSSNDNASTAAAITAARLATLQAIRAVNKLAPIVVIGVPSINLAGTTAAQIEVAIQAAVTAMADPRIFFISVATDTPPWVTGSWNNSGTPGLSAGTTGGGVNGSYYIAGDNIHPPEIGYAYYAQRIAAAMRSRVLPYI